MLKNFGKSSLLLFFVSSILSFFDSEIDRDLDVVDQKQDRLF